MEKRSIYVLAFGVAVLSGSYYASRYYKLKGRKQHNPASVKPFSQREIGTDVATQTTKHGEGDTSDRSTNTDPSNEFVEVPDELYVGKTWDWPNWSGVSR
jgi:hypothetical protein